MDKQKKQLIILVVLIAVAAVVGIFMLNRGSEAPPPPPPVADPAAQQPPAGAAPAAGAPAAGGAPGAAPAPLEDLKKPDLTIPDHREVSVDPEAKDPLRVLNPDVAFKQTAKEIQELRENWHVKGICVAGKEEVISIISNPDGTKGEKREIREVWACFFDDNPRYYREGDRLEGTYFKVRRIVHNFREAFVEVEGDTGAIVKLPMILNDRYGQINKKR